MRYQKTARPEVCVSKEVTRYSPNGVGVIEHGGNVYLAATDGRCATMIRAYPEAGDQGYAGQVYPAAAFVAARKATSRGTDESTVRLNGSAVVKSGESTTDFPRVESTFPEVFACVPKGNATRITINAELLAKMQEAFGSGAVTLDIGDECTPILVRPVVVEKGGYVPTADGSQGVLMPIGKRK